MTNLEIIRVLGENMGYKVAVKAKAMLESEPGGFSEENLKEPLNAILQESLKGAVAGRKELFEGNMDAGVETFIRAVTDTYVSTFLAITSPEQASLRVTAKVVR